MDSLLPVAPRPSKWVNTSFSATLKGLEDFPASTSKTAKCIFRLKCYNLSFSSDLKILEQ